LDRGLTRSIVSITSLGGKLAQHRRPVPVHNLPLPARAFWLLA
jgi:hypothetical protein